MRRPAAPTSTRSPTRSPRTHTCLANPVQPGGGNTRQRADSLVPRTRRPEPRSTRLFEGNLVFTGESKWTCRRPGRLRRRLPMSPEGLADQGRRHQQPAQLPLRRQPSPADLNAAACNPAERPLCLPWPINEYDIARNIYAAFAEVSLLSPTPVVDLAGRFEDYGAQGGSRPHPRSRCAGRLWSPCLPRFLQTTSGPGPPAVSEHRIACANVLGAFRGIATTGNPTLSRKRPTPSRWA